MLGRSSPTTLFWLALVFACSSTTKTEGGATCVRGHQQSCRGLGSCEGTQTCNDEGTAYSDCECSGVDGSAGTGANGGVGGTSGASGGSGGTGGKGASGGTGGTGGTTASGGSGGPTDASSDAPVCNGMSVPVAECVNTLAAAGSCPSAVQCACASCACDTVTCFSDPGCSVIVACMLANCPNGGDPNCANQYCGSEISQYQGSLTLVQNWSACVSQMGCSC